ncbi:MAG: hypothetical protein ACKO6N_03745 [Myxococcota bacterium]
MSIQARRLLLATMGAVLGFSVVYVLALLGMPGPVYHPHERAWTLNGDPSLRLGMLYFRQLGYGLLATLLGAALAYQVGRVWNPSREAWAFLLAWTVILLSVVMLYSGFQAFRG